MTKTRTVLFGGYVFTREQIAEQQAFARDLAGGNADIAFEGSRLEAMAFLSGLEKLCGQ